MAATQGSFGACRRARVATHALAASLLLAPAPSAFARVEFSVGQSWTLLPYRYTDVAFAEWIGAAQPWWKITWSPAVTVGFVESRSNTPTVRLDENVWVFAGGARAYLWRDLFFGFQFATTAGKTDALSTPYEFVSSLGWQGDHFQVMFRHISNGDFHEPNHGETMFLVGLAF